MSVSNNDMMSFLFVPTVTFQYPQKHKETLSQNFIRLLFNRFVSRISQGFSKGRSWYENVSTPQYMMAQKIRKPLNGLSPNLLLFPLKSSKSHRFSN